VKKAIVSAVTALLLISGSATSSAQDVSALEKRLDALEQEVRVLRRQLEVEKEEKAKKAAESAVVTASAKDGFSIKSTDDNFSLKVRGYVMGEGRFFTDNKKDIGTTDTFVARRVRPIFEGTVYTDFGYFIQPDFGNGTTVLQDGWGEFKRWTRAKLRIGKLKTPFGLERLQPDVFNDFIELGLPSLLAPNRDVGVMLHGEFQNGLVAYQTAVLNGVADSGSGDSDTNSDKDVVARIFAHPFKEFDFEPLHGLGVGAAVSAGHQEGSTLPTFKSAGQASIFSYSSGTVADGPHNRFSPQAYYYYGPLGLIVEYAESVQEVSRTTTPVSEKIHMDAWQVAGTWVLTGEDATYKGVSPRHSFDPSKGEWGALELAARIGALDIDNDAFALGFANPNTSVSALEEWALGMNWYLNRNVKLVLNYVRSDFDGGGPGSEDRQTENVILTRAQVLF